MENLHSLIENNDVKQAIPDWTHRRLVVKWSLLLNAIVFLMVSITVCFSIVWIVLKEKTINIPSDLTNIVNTILYIIGLMTTSIIGSYVFGAQWDINKFRNFLGTIFGGSNSGS
jgi:F0F1-type ATP synthase membrane subunit a